MDPKEPRKKVLCIDDTPTVRRLVRRLLFQKYDVLEAKTGLEGIDLAQATHPDLILVDLHLPQLNGYEVATRLSALLPETPIIALTADTSEYVRERALASGCWGYIAKPIEADEFQQRVDEYLGGVRETLEDRSFVESYQQTLVARLEEKVRELTEALQENERLNRQNRDLLAQAERRSRLLEAAARVSHSITSILDLDALLHATVDIICDEFGFYYAGVFLVDEAGEWAVLRAGRGEAGRKMVEAGHRLRIGGSSMIGTAIAERKARIALDVGDEPVHFKNPYLPHTRSEMALPLVVRDKVIGALTIQSVEEAAFTEDDITALQTMADQLAVAINNARLLADLEEAHRELVRSKTFEAIATATGEAIHWVGNKAAPIPGSVQRIREDLSRYLIAAHLLLAEAPEEVRESKFAALLEEAYAELQARGVDLAGLEKEMRRYSLRRLLRILTVESIFEDLEIIENSARSILNIKEDLIGPARKKRLQVFDLNRLLRETVARMGIKDVEVVWELEEGLPPVRADRVQLGRVFINLIKNAVEAMEGRPVRRLTLGTIRSEHEPGFVVVDVADTGVGIPADQLDKIWMAFYTTKGDRGGTGLGLPACAQIVGDLGGRIVVQSEVGVGTIFSVHLPTVDADADAPTHAIYADQSKGERG